MTDSVRMKELTELYNQVRIRPTEFSTEDADFIIKKAETYDKPVLTFKDEIRINHLYIKYMGEGIK